MAIRCFPLADNGSGLQRILRGTSDVNERPRATLLFKVNLANARLQDKTKKLTAFDQIHNILSCLRKIL